jgi:hypothetical protein
VVKTLQARGVPHTPYPGTHRSWSDHIKKETPCPLFFGVCLITPAANLTSTRALRNEPTQVSETGQRVAFTVAEPSSARVALRVFLVLPHSCRRPCQRRVFLFISNHSTTNRRTPWAHVLVLGLHDATTSRQAPKRYSHPRASILPTTLILGRWPARRKDYDLTKIQSRPPAHCTSDSVTRTPLTDN